VRAGLQSRVQGRFLGNKRRAMDMRAKWAMTRLSLWDLFYAVDMSIACAISNWGYDPNTFATW